MEPDQSGRHPGCDYIASDYCIRCGWPFRRQVTDTDRRAAVTRWVRESRFFTMGQVRAMRQRKAERRIAEIRTLLAKGEKGEHSG